MDKRAVDIIEDDFDRVMGLELKTGLIGGKSKLIGFSHRVDLLDYLVNFPCSWG